MGCSWWIRIKMLSIKFSSSYQRMNWIAAILSWQMSVLKGPITLTMPFSAGGDWTSQSWMQESGANWTVYLILMSKYGIKLWRWMDEEVFLFAELRIRFYWLTTTQSFWDFSSAQEQWSRETQGLLLSLLLSSVFKVIIFRHCIGNCSFHYLQILHYFQLTVLQSGLFVGLHSLRPRSSRPWESVWTVYALDQRLRLWLMTWKITTEMGGNAWQTQHWWNAWEGLVR